MLYNKDELVLDYISHGLTKAFHEINCVRTDSLTAGQNITKGEYDELVQSFFFLMPSCNLTSKDHTITFEECGTDFIKQIFETEVDDNTLVISTQHEHGNVKKELSTCKHTLLLEYDNDILQKQNSIDNIIIKAKEYSKVFVYIIGTQICSGRITPQQFIANLKEKLIDAKIEHKIMLDDVHGMFMHPRDYSIFDYVLYTAHAIIPNYNMGLLISKDGKYGYKAFNAAARYIQLLHELLKYKKDLLLFKEIMIEYFYDFLKYPYCQLYSNTVNHIFALDLTDIIFDDTVYKKLDEHGVFISEQHYPKNFLQIRFQEFLEKDINEAIQSLHLATDCLRRGILKAQLGGNK